MLEITPETLQRWLREPEGERLEFKAARNTYSAEKLTRYCCALSNEGGGHFVLGVGDERPRTVGGTAAFPDLAAVRADLYRALRLRVETVELHPEGRRVLVFRVPARPLGVPLSYQDTYWMRAGEELTAMAPERLRRIFDETVPDFSATTLSGATLADLDPAAIGEFRRRWREHAGPPRLAALSDEQLLTDAELVEEGVPTVAALVLLGRREALGRRLAQAEVIFEFRSTETAGPAQQRLEFREGFFLFFDRLWELVDLRNDRQHYQSGLFMREVPTFDEGVVREALLNAVSHRDYRDAGSVFVRQYSRRLVVESPGGLPDGITFENILHRQKPRNRRIAESLARTGLIDRSGQGMNRMFERAVRQSKGLPEFSGSDEHQVVLTLPGAVQDEALLRFFEQVGQETLESFSTEDFLLVDRVRRGDAPRPDDRPALRRLADIGLLERVGQGRGSRYLLAGRFYRQAGRSAEYTRRRGLDRGTQMALLEDLLSRSEPQGARLSELHGVLPQLSVEQVRTMLRQMQRDGRARSVGKGNGARWHREASSGD